MTSPPRRSAPAARVACSDRGSTFVEILVAIVLLGLSVSTVIAGIRTTIAVSTTNDEQAKLEAVLTNAADGLAGWSYRPCPGANGEEYEPIVSAAASSVGWDPSQIQIIDVAFWDPAAGGGSGDIIEADGAWAPSNTMTGAECNEDINYTTSRTLQRITIRATTPDGDFTRTLEVIKSNIVASPDTEST